MPVRRGGRRVPLACAWLPELAAGYLGGYESRPQRSRPFWGYSFAKTRGVTRAGFFVGFLTHPPGWTRGPFAPPFRPPECVVLAFVEPAGGAQQRSFDSLFRSRYDLLAKYTVRRPRWEFYEAPKPALVRRVPLGEFPPRQRQKYARNFFMESLAILVRSGLPERLAQGRGVP